ncbi:unnamed protein product [Colias eurytheme]|nr:unnamed protein product [Colias eurytheme]
MEYFIPFSDVYIDDKARPWFNAECATAERNKQRAYQAWADARIRKAPDLHEKKKTFNKAAKLSKKALKKARFDHIRHIGHKLTSYPAGSKAFWSLAKVVESNFSRPSIPPLQKPDGTLAHSAKEKAETFAKLFAENSRLDSMNKTPPSIPNCGSVMPDISIRQKDVLHIMRNLDVNKASGPDGIPAIVLKTCAPELSPVLTRLFRLSLKSGKVPKSWKLANVQPVPKKGSRADPANYRPISITSIICKIMERLLNNRLLAYLETHDILSDRQYGFRKNRSTGDLLVHATHLWGQAIENYGEALAVSLDISKAFDRVWHASLLNRLPSYGVPPELCAWIADFLSERSIRVVIDGCTSDPFDINAGVPQGSVLSTTLFLLHINDMLRPNVFGYADDSTVVESYFSNALASRDSIEAEREAMIVRLNNTLMEISNWGDANLVKFNACKTQACLFTAKKSTLQLTPSFRDVPIEVSDHLELLGLSVSSNLNYGHFIESKAQLAAKKLGILAKSLVIARRRAAAAAGVAI